MLLYIWDWTKYGRLTSRGEPVRGGQHPELRGGEYQPVAVGRGFWANSWKQMAAAAAFALVALVVLGVEGYLIWLRAPYQRSYSRPLLIIEDYAVLALGGLLLLTSLGGVVAAVTSYLRLRRVGGEVGPLTLPPGGLPGVADPEPEPGPDRESIELQSRRRGWVMRAWQVLWAASFIGSAVLVFGALLLDPNEHFDLVGWLVSGFVVTLIVWLPILLVGVFIHKIVRSVTTGVD